MPKDQWLAWFNLATGKSRVMVTLKEGKQRNFVSIDMFQDKDPQELVFRDSQNQPWRIPVAEIEDICLRK